MTGVLARARTWLFVPGDRPDRFSRAHASGAEIVVVDLEDAVAPDGRDTARAGLGRALEATVGDRRPVVVRVHAAADADHEDDLEAVRAVREGLHAVMLAKVSDGEEVARVSDALSGLPVVALVESARGVERLSEIAGVPGLARLGLGSVDLGLDLGVDADSATLAYARSRLVVGSRAAGLPAPIDSPCLVLREPEPVEAHARRARATGMGGVLCVHPAQVPVVAGAMRPGREDIAWARAVLGSAGHAGRGAVDDDGRMVDAPVLELARRLLAETEAPR